jgi:hypothetical protein
VAFEWPDGYVGDSCPGCKRALGAEESLINRDERIAGLEGRAWDRLAAKENKRLQERIAELERETAEHHKHCWQGSAQAEVERLRNGCEQALLLLGRKRFKDDSEAKVVSAVLCAALANDESGEAHG